MRKKNIFLFLVLLAASNNFAQSRVINFTGIALKDSIRLSFGISAGPSCGGYQVLKGSDSLNLFPIYVYGGICGNTTYNENYTYMDYSPNTALPNFYRILIPPGDYSNLIRIDMAASFSNMIIFPQPAEDLMSIKILNKSNFYYELKIYDRFGRKMAESNGNATDRITLNVSGFPLGVYAFYVVDINGNAYRGKFLKN